MPKKRKKIAICHYRVGKTDGVSLEIEKRKKILEKHNCEVILIAGGRSNGTNHVIKELEWDDGVVPIIKENGFVHFKRKDLTAKELKIKINQLVNSIQDKLNFIQLKEKFDHILIHNIFSFGGHIAASKAFTKWIKRFEIHTIATHHDFYWERKEFQFASNGYLKNFMNKYMPPKSKYIEHVVINSLAQKELQKRFNIKADIMPDVFDFEKPEWKLDNFNSTFLKELAVNPNDLIILQATRVIPRKGIEIAIDFARTLDKKLKKLKGKKIYNNKKIKRNSRVVLLVAGYAEEEKREYLFKLKNKSFDSQVMVKFISNHVKAKRKFSQGIKTYSLWDAYAHADIVSYPSIWEGWGNQFIEAVFAKKPIIIYEYPVFKSDIKSEGYQVISLGNGGNNLTMNDESLVQIPQNQIDSAVKKTINWLGDKKTNEMLEKNWQIGKNYHNFNVLEKFLVKKLNL